MIPLFGELAECRWIQRHISTGCVPAFVFVLLPVVCLPLYSKKSKQTPSRSCLSVYIAEYGSLNELSFARITDNNGFIEYEFLPIKFGDQ